jgi:Ni/Co efflux regulator RcnB
MNPIAGTRGAALALILAGALASGAALADKPSYAGKGKDGRAENSSRDNDRNDRNDRNERNDRDDRNDRHSYFDDRHRGWANEYHDREVNRGRCPPGLAKKHNGCMPPGLAKKWHVGQRMPRDVVFYNLPPRLASRFGPPPAGQRFVRVDNDVLLIQAATGLVLDALLNFGRG